LNLQKSAVFYDRCGVEELLSTIKNSVEIMEMVHLKIHPGRLT